MKNIIFTGVQPSGKQMTIGNYIGMLKNFEALRASGSFDEVFFSIVDQHALTTDQDAETLRERILMFAAVYLAAFPDDTTTHLFIQSEIKEHAELTWYLTTKTYMGELERMTQFKDKSAKQTEGINVGLFSYPILMASDILLYNTTHVPVGDDQKQHLELTRDLALRINKQAERRKKDAVFVVPEPVIGTVGKRIMSLTDPTKKMSKSDENPKSYILITDDEKTIAKKLKSAVTDSLGTITYDPVHQKGVANLLDIIASFEKTTPEAIALELEGQNYGALKHRAIATVTQELKAFQERYYRLLEDQIELNKRLDAGRDAAQVYASKKMKEVYSFFGVGRQ